MPHTSTVSGRIVDLIHSDIYEGSVVICNGKIADIKKEPVCNRQYIMPGFIDSHVHIESSMLPPAEFARIAVCHGTVASISDPHEIANVLGIEGIKYMIKNGQLSPFKFYFGAPPCVPATNFETSGCTIDAQAIAELMKMDNIYFLSEMMNYPGVLAKDTDIMKKIQAALDYHKPIDGHAPTLKNESLETYIQSGISTDHECFSIQEAIEKIQLGVKILIREGSAAKNFDTLIPLMHTYPHMLMFCSDDKHPHDLIKGHINTLVKKAVNMGYNIMDVLKAASVNVIQHYKLDVGLLQKGDSADFIVVDNLQSFNILQTYIKGILVARNSRPLLPFIHSDTPNRFISNPIRQEDIAVEPQGKDIKVIVCHDKQLNTDSIIAKPKIENNNIVSDTDRDILKMVVVNRYTPSKPAIGFIRNIGLKQGAIASSIAHDSHNIIAVGVTDKDITNAVNLIIKHQGGVVAYSPRKQETLPLPIAGLMSADNGYSVADTYEKVNTLTHQLGSALNAPLMTLAFMSLLVIPELKLSDQGLFDAAKFNFTSLFVE
ncbi:MAG: adenine deaminase [Bacteroidales bacterium]|nr:adenine deaminase [Bacteroidales bacterium]